MHQEEETGPELDWPLHIWQRNSQHCLPKKLCSPIAKPQESNNTPIHCFYFPWKAAVRERARKQRDDGSQETARVEGVLCQQNLHPSAQGNHS